MMMTPYRRQILVAAALALLSVLLMVTGLTAAVTRSLGSVFDPWRAERMAEGLDNSSDEGHKEEQTIQAVSVANHRLKAINADLRQRLAEYEAIAGEGGQDPQTVVVARVQVVSQSSREGQERSAVIDVDGGALDHVKLGMVAMVGWCLVGQVAGEGTYRSTIRLITDKDSRVPATLFAADRERPVAEGVLAGSSKPDHCRLLYVEDHPDLEVELGMQVYTSGLAGHFLPHMPLGVVTEAQRQVSSDMWSIEVRPHYRLSTITNLLIADFEKHTDTTQTEDREQE